MKLFGQCSGLTGSGTLRLACLCLRRRSRSECGRGSAMALKVWTCGLCTMENGGLISVFCSSSGCSPHGLVVSTVLFPLSISPSVRRRCSQAMSNVRNTPTSSCSYCRFVSFDCCSRSSQALKLTRAPLPTPLLSTQPPHLPLQPPRPSFGSGTAPSAPSRMGTSFTSARCAVPLDPRMLWPFSRVQQPAEQMSQLPSPPLLLLLQLR